VSKSKKLEIYWYTVSYRKIFIAAFLIVLLLVLFTIPFIKENFKQFAANKLEQLLDSNTTPDGSEGTKHGRFSLLSGTIKVKKANSTQWITADAQTQLETGDYIQTSSDSKARIHFPDGTTYLMSPDSLLVVQENSENPKTMAKKVSIRVTSGSIDLSTSRRDVPTSRSEVSGGAATAVVDQDSRMAVEMNPITKTSSFALGRGHATVSHANGGETSIGPFETVTATEKQFTKEKMLAPPDSLTPDNIRPILCRQGAATVIRFSWKAIPQATAYRIRISNSQIFSKILREEIIRGKTQYETSGLDEGTFYWAVSSIDEVQNKTSKENDPPNKFTLIFTTGGAKEESNIFLKIDRVYRLGNYYEIIGRTDPSATVIINDETVLTRDGTFKHITSPVPHQGRYVITITAQDRSGNSKSIPYIVDVD
jgi:hypothetical protein